MKVSRTINCMDLFQRIREASKTVAERASSVRIDRARMREYRDKLQIDQATPPAHDPRHHYLGHGDDTVAFFLILDAINFGSGYFPKIQKREGLSGYFTVAASLNDSFQQKGPLTARDCERLTMFDCTKIFGQSPNNDAARELMKLFSIALNDLGRLIQTKYDGSFVRIVDTARGSAATLIELLAEMPYFRDVQNYGDLEVPFYKRAQLTAADLALAFGGEGPGHFADLDKLTIFADNLVPHVLRVDKILIYDEDLANRIDDEQLIATGSREEIEIRACALHAVELLVEEFSLAGRPLTAATLDHVLWNRGQHRSIKSQPRHRARTVYY